MKEISESFYNDDSDIFFDFGGFHKKESMLQ